MRWSHILLFSLLMPLLFAGPSQAETPARSLRLPNGLEVVMMPDASSPLLSSLLLVRAGSANEDLATAGATHMLEHMIFRGTTRRGQLEIYDAFDRMGAYYNATTRRNSTSFILVVPASDASAAMELQADMVLRPALDADSFRVEKGRVLEEMARSEARSSYEAELNHLYNLYGETSYGHPTLGTSSSIDALDVTTVRDFHDSWYAVNNMVLILRGDLSYEEMEQLARRHYGGEAAKPLPQRPRAWPVGFENWRQGHLHKVAGARGGGSLTLALPAPRHDDNDYPAYQALSLLLSQRLSSELVSGPEPMAMYAGASLVLDPAFSVLEIDIRLLEDQDEEQLLDRCLELISDFSRQPPSVEELESAVANERRDELFFSEQVQYGAFLLIDRLALEPWGFWQAYEKARADLRPGTINEVAARWFGDPLWVATAQLPDEQGQDGQGEGIELGEVAVDTLDNGLVLIVRQASGAPVAGLHLVARDRARMEGEARRGWAALLHRSLELGSGIGGEQKLKERLESIGMSLSATDDSRIPMDNYRSTPEYSFVRCEVIGDRWPEALSLLADLFGNGQVDEASADRMVGELRSRIEAGKGALASRVNQAFDSLLVAPHPLAATLYGDGSSLDSLTLRALNDFRRAYFAADNLVLAMISPASAEEQLATASAILAGLEPGRPQLTPTPAPQPKGGAVEVTGRSRSARYSGGFTLLEPRREDHAALAVLDELISAEAYRDLSEARGLTYSAGVSITLRDDWGLLRASTSLRPDRIEEMKDIRGHFERYIDGTWKEDIPADRFEAARGALRGSILRRYSSRINLAMGLSVDYLLHGDPLYTWSLYDEAGGLELDDLARTARRYLRKHGPVAEVIGLPEPPEQQPSMGAMGGMGGMGH